jgi:glycine cleavage system H protein
MSGFRVFMMGKYEARLPDDRRYAKNHMWAQAQATAAGCDELAEQVPAPAEAAPGARLHRPGTATEQAARAQAAPGAPPAEAAPARLFRFGFSAYAVRLLQDVYFLDWTVDCGGRLRERQCIGSIESSKAESDLFAPISGTLVRFNSALLKDPSAINIDTYGPGWLFEMAGSGQELLTVDEYLQHLEEAWVVAQRTIKGQLNEA